MAWKASSASARHRQGAAADAEDHRAMERDQGGEGLPVARRGVAAEKFGPVQPGDAARLEEPADRPVDCLRTAGHAHCPLILSSTTILHGVASMVPEICRPGTLSTGRARAALFA